MTAPTIDQTQRILAWDGCYNVRDAGGLPTTHSRAIRDRALVRSDVLSRLTDRGRQALVEYGVRTIIDVRSAFEVARDWHSYPFRDVVALTDEGGPQVSYRNLPFSGGADDQALERLHDAYAKATTRAELNRLDIDAHGSGIGVIVGAVADAPEGGVLVHCHAGKDRTGLVVALLLSVAGVGDDDVGDDYALTALNLAPLIAEWLDEMSADDNERSRLRDLAEPRREAMIDSLSYVRDKFGSVEAYLRTHGVTADQLNRIRLRLVELEDRPNG